MFVFSPFPRNDDSPRQVLTLSARRSAASPLKQPGRRFEAAVTHWVFAMCLVSLAVSEIEETNPAW
jgi:hypothetical protein